MDIQSIEYPLIFYNITIPKKKTIIPIIRGKASDKLGMRVEKESYYLDVI